MVSAVSDPNDIQRLVGDLIRLATVASVDLADGTCIVRAGAIELGPVSWIAHRAGGTAAWSPPTIGEQGILLCPEGDPAAGIMLFGVYSDAMPAPASADKLELLKMADGAILSYDAAAHKLVAQLPAGATAEITAPGGLTVTGPVTIAGKLTVQDDVAVTGKVAAQGDMTAQGDVKAGAISLKAHKHGGVQAGGAISGPAQ